MPRLRTVTEAVSDVRSLLDERNTDTVQESIDIIASLNRAQNYAFNILARHYEEPLLQKVSVSAGISTVEWELPENMFEDRLEKIEFYKDGIYSEVRRVSYRDFSKYECDTSVDVPDVYCVFGRSVRFAPQPNGNYSYRYWYLREPDELTVPLGRITSVGSDYVITDTDQSTDLTESDTLANFVNIIDGQTGEIKQTLQVNSVSGQKLTFRSALSSERTSLGTIVNRTISTSVSSDVELDDYVCGVRGTCVPFFGYPIYNFLVQYAVAELKRKLGNTETAVLEEQVKKEFEQQVERSWVGRESSKQIKSRRGRRSSVRIPKSID